MLRLIAGLAALSATLFLQAQTPELTVPIGHSKLIYDVAYSPNGKYAASASADRTVKIWELDKGREVRTIFIETGYATSVQFAADNRHLLVGGGDYDIGILKIFDLETGETVTNMTGHTEYAWQAEFSTDGKYVFSAGFDGVLKKWDAATGNLLLSTPAQNQLFRGLSVDPRGEFVATTADTGDSLALVVWSAANLEPVQFINVRKPGDNTWDSIGYWYVDNLLYEPRDVAFSARGNYLIAGGFNGQLAVYQRGADTAFLFFQAHDDEVGGIFTNAEETAVYTCGFDRMIHAWDLKTGEHIRSFEGHGDRIYDIDPHPAGGKFISGGSFDKSVMEWDMETGRILRRLKGNVYPVKRMILADGGRQLFINAFDDFGGDVYAWRTDRLNRVKNLGAPESHPQYMVRADSLLAVADRWGALSTYRLDDLSPVHDVNLSRNISSLQVPEGWPGLVVGLEKPAGDYGRSNFLGDYDLPTGELYRFPSPYQEDTRNEYAVFSEDGQIAVFMYTDWGSVECVVMHLPTGQGEGSLVDTSYFNPMVALSPDNRYIILSDNGRMDFHDWRDSSQSFTIEGLPRGGLTDILFLNQDVFALSGGDWSDGYIALGSVSERRILRQRTDFTSAQNCLVWDAERNLLISGAEDSRITFFNANDLSTQLTLFNFGDTGGEWAALHPSGLFDGSQGAIESYLYFTYRLEPIELFQLKERYYEPGLMQKVLGYNAEPIRDVSAFREVALYPRAVLSLNGDTLRVDLLERSGGIGSVSFLINGKEMLGDLSGLLQKEAGAGHYKARIALGNFDKFLLPGEENRLEVITSNTAGNMTSPVYHLAYTPALRGGFGGVTERPSLYAVVVGTSDYRGTTLDLNYAAKDAGDMAGALKTGGIPLFGEDHVHIFLLSTDQEDPAGQPTRVNIDNTLATIAAEARPEDVLIIYLSGHGVTYGSPEAQFHYLTKDVETGDISDPAVREQYTFSTDDLTRAIKGIAAQKQILIIDACASGQAVDDLLALSKDVNSGQIKALDRMKDRTGLFILAGSAANRVSYEASQYGQSLLTYSLLEGMNLLSAKSESRLVDLVSWINHGKEKVPELAESIGGIQEPVIALPRNLNSFDIAHLPDGTSIPVARVKPVFVRSTLLETSEMDDVLALSDKLDGFFQELSAKGRASQVIFVDVKRFPQAYSVKGFYETDGDTVSVTATLRRGEEKLGLIEVSGPAGDPDALVRQMIGIIEGLIDGE